ncbi:MAG: DUF6011 domain-containing protein [Dehalococcoidales bacterium]|nr:DUF6011 domain-containing protein [Dehalococcoidales bacterium]
MPKCNEKFQEPLMSPPPAHRCLICGRKLKRRKYRRAGMGPRCRERLEKGFAGIQIKAFEKTGFLNI